jgi:alanine racemase
LALITISKSNYFYNLDRVRERVADISQIAVVLKDNGYGHGIELIAQLAQEYGVTRAVVRTFKEAKKIENFFQNILILAPEKIENVDNFSYTINSLQDLDRFSKGCRVELKVDTGMHRLGISSDELETALKRIEEKNLNLTGLFTHHREADELSSVYFWQREKFEKIKRDIQNRGYKNIVFHSNNSAGVFRRGEIISDEVVRVGIASYGYLADLQALQFPTLKPVLSLYVDRIGFRTAQEGFRIGYGGVSEIEEEEFIGIYDVGYGDGFRRLPVEAIENREFKTPDGSYILGKVSMDSIALNSRRQRVLLFNSVKKLAKIFETIDYEIVVNLSPSIERVVVE